MWRLTVPFWLVVLFVVGVMAFPQLWRDELDEMDQNPDTH